MLNNQQVKAVTTTLRKMKMFQMMKMDKHVIKINALPGTGKSFTAVQLATQAANLGYSVLVMAFLGDNVKELESKMNHKNITVSTSHSAGKRALQLHLKKSKTFARTKTWRLSAYLNKNNIKKQQIILQAVSLAKANLTSDIGQIVKFYNLKMDSEQIGYAQNALAFINENEIDFDDMIYIPVNGGYVTELYDLVILDEAQDQSLAQIELAKSLSKNTMVLLGDDNQAVYGFRGAGNYQEIDNALLFGLSLTYRFGDAIANFVNEKFGTDITPANEKFGMVSECDHNFLTENLTDDSMIVARTNAELIPVALRSIANDKKVQLTNKKLLSNLATMITSAASSKSCECGGDMELLDGKYGTYYKCLDCNKNLSIKKAGKPVICETSASTLEKLTNQLFNMRQDATPLKIEEYDDMLSIFTFLLENNTPENTLNELRKLSNSRAGATLTTCHKAKGMESENVYVLMDGFNKCAGMAVGEFWERQERNLLLVAMTRAKTNMYIL